MRQLSIERGILSCGFLLLAAAALWAHQSPATGYELSVYTGTPVVFWILLAIGFLSAAYISFNAASRGHTVGGHSLVVMLLITLVALPIIRGYRFLGEDDSLSHLGVLRQILAEDIAIDTLRYPAIHTLSAFITLVTGKGPEFGIILVVPILTASYLIFIPLVVRQLSPDPLVVGTGVFTAALLLPINHAGTHMVPHPTSQAVFYLPLVLFVFVRAVVISDRIWNAVFVVASSSLVLYHPQQAANFLVFLGGIAGIHLVMTTVRSYRSNQIPHIHSPVLLMIIFGVIFWLWVGDLPVFEHSLSTVVGNIISSSQAAESTVTRGASLAQFGGSLTELFLRLYFVSIVFCLFAVITMVSIIVGQFDRFESTSVGPKVPEFSKQIVFYFSIGIIPVSGMFFVYFIIGFSDQYFRHQGFIMVIVTILGIFGIAEVMDRVNNICYLSRGSLLTLTFLLFLVLTIPVIHSSPFIYLDSRHVTESQLSGYETAIEHWDGESDFIHVRSPAHRYDRGTGQNKLNRDISVQSPNHFNDHNLQALSDQRQILVVTEADHVRDVRLYQGFRFSRYDFAYVDSERGINKIQSSEGVDVYTIP